MYLSNRDEYRGGVAGVYRKEIWYSNKERKDLDGQHTGIEHI